MASGVERDEAFLRTILVEIDRVWDNEKILAQRIERGTTVTSQLAVIEAALGRIESQLRSYRASTGSISGHIKIIVNQIDTVKQHLTDVSTRLASRRTVSTELIVIRKTFGRIETELTVLANNLGFNISKTPERGSFLERITHF